MIKRLENVKVTVTVSTKVDDRSGQPVVNQANKIPKTHKKEPQIDREDPLLKERRDPLYSEILEWLPEFRKIWWMMKFLNMETLTPVLLMKYV